MKFALRHLVLFLFLFSFSAHKAQVSDSLYLLNGNVVGERVIDTLLGAITIYDKKKPGKKIHYEWDQLYMVKFANGDNRYYYQQDSTKNNWFSREEMWLFMKGENDSRRGFKPWGSAIGAGLAGFIGGMSGTFWGPILPYGYMAFSGITKVKIKQHTVSKGNFTDYDAYLLGYERTARQKRKIWSLIYGTAGLVAGYGFYAAFHNSYPESFQIKFLNISL
jgi:hypothetical protein